MIVNRNNRYTEAKLDASVYAHLLEWPSADSTVTLGSPSASSSTQIYLLGCAQALAYDVLPTGGVKITVPPRVLTDIALRRREWKCAFTLVFKLVNLNL